MEWLNEPASWQRTGDLLTVSVDPGTDFWRETGYGYIRDSGHVYGDVLAGDLDVSVRLRCTLGVQYDQAGVMLRADERTWLKTGVEFFEGRARLSTVLTLGRSSWMVTDLPEGTDDIVLRVSRRGDAVEVRYMIQDGPAELAALVFLPPGREVLAGVMAAAPEGPGFQVTFHDLRITERDWSGPAADEATAWAEEQADWATEQAPDWSAADGEPRWAAPEEEPDTLDWPATAAEAQPPAWPVPAAGEESDWQEPPGEGDVPGWVATTAMEEAPDWAAAEAEHDEPGWAAAKAEHDEPGWAVSVADATGPQAAAADEPAADDSGPPEATEPGPAEAAHAEAAPELLAAEPARAEPAAADVDPPAGDVDPPAADVDPAADWERLAAGAQAAGPQAASWRAQTDAEVANEWPGPPMRAAIRNGLLTGGATAGPAEDAPDDAQTDPGLPRPDTAVPAEPEPGEPEAASAAAPESGAAAPESGAAGPAEPGAADPDGPEPGPADAGADQDATDPGRSTRAARRARSKRAAAGKRAEPDAADEWISLLTADPGEE